MGQEQKISGVNNQKLYAEGWNFGFIKSKYQGFLVGVFFKVDF